MFVCSIKKFLEKIEVFRQKRKDVSFKQISKVMNFQEFLQHSKLDSKDYQREGVEWCIDREQGVYLDEEREQIDQETSSPQSQYCRGGIVADEMGLGKTIMMIATIVCNFTMPTLIVLPNVLLEQWKEQIYKTTGHRAIVYHGQVKKILTVNQLQHMPIILTTYGTVLADARKDKKLQQVKWGRIICDEAHHLRNRRTKVAKVVGSLQTKIMWLITGTPIQNHINDLFSLFDILKISNKVYTDVEKLKNIISTIVLKRTKKEVGIKLPQLKINRIKSDWVNSKEQALSEDIHDKLSFSLLKQKPIDNNLRLSTMLCARMLCVYPKMATKYLHKLKTMGYIDDENFEGLNQASKMDSVIAKIVERKANGNRKIVFANFKDEIDHIKSTLTTNGLTVESIDGRVASKKKRQEILSSDIDVLILQIKTGNEGLNLQQYNEVYFVTPDWNPKVEEQAIARCHRLGQNKEVHVFHFVMDNFDLENKTMNIEMYSENVQTRKREIGEQVLCE
jgi:SNF2 family DNA or RNA helicase